MKNVIPEIGSVYYYKNKYIVYITEGAYERNGRVSNHWYFKYVLEDGTLGQTDCDYGKDFTDAPKNIKPVITVNLGG